MAIGKDSTVLKLSNFAEGGTDLFRRSLVLPDPREGLNSMNVFLTIDSTLVQLNASELEGEVSERDETSSFSSPFSERQVVGVLTV
jgi:hypothetical protein